MHILVRSALATVALTFASAAPAATTLIEFADARGYDWPDWTLNDNPDASHPHNSIISRQLDPYAWIRNITYSVTVETPVSLAGTAVWFGATSDGFVQFLPNSTEDEPGKRTYSGTIDLKARAVDFWLDDDGVLKLQFADYYAPYSNTDQITYSSSWNGWFKVDYDRVAAVPEPASWTMALLGFGLLGATLRRHGTRRVRFHTRRA